jgi:hypothetical protein
MQSHVQGCSDADQGIQLGEPKPSKNLRQGAFVDAIFVREEFRGSITALFDDFPDVFAELAPDFRVFSAQDKPKVRERGSGSSG